MAHASLLLARASLVALAVSIAGATGPAFANSSGGSGSGGSTPACPSGYVYDKNQQTCVKSSSMNDEQLYQQGRDLALAGRYDEALDACRHSLAADAQDERALLIAVAACLSLGRDAHALEAAACVADLRGGTWTAERVLAELGIGDERL